MKQGAVLLGIVMPDGRIAFAPDRLEVNSEFIGSAQEGRSPEKRFRFAAPCVQDGCLQWTGKRCGVIDEVLQETKGETSGRELPNCSIRTDCRWYHQAGARACDVCPLVITDGRTESPSNTTPDGPDRP